MCLWGCVFVSIGIRRVTCRKWRCWIMITAQRWQPCLRAICDLRDFSVSKNIQEGNSCLIRSDASTWITNIIVPKCHQIFFLGAVWSWAVADLAMYACVCILLGFLVFLLPQTKQLKGCFQHHIFFALWVRWYTLRTVQNQEVLHGRCHPKLNETFSQGTWTPIRQEKQTVYEMLLREWKEGRVGGTQTFYIVSGAIFYGQTTQSAICWGIWKMGFSFSDDRTHSLPWWWNDINPSSAFIYLQHSISNLILQHEHPHLPWL